MFSWSFLQHIKEAKDDDKACAEWRDAEVQVKEGKGKEEVSVHDKKVRALKLGGVETLLPAVSVLLDRASIKPHLEIGVNMDFGM